jgi:membrane protein YqaA with SNARE-associated domain
MINFLQNQLSTLKKWVEHFATLPHALVALFFIAFVEAAIFPVPPDVLLLALGVITPRKSIMYGCITAAGSFAGGYVGYFLGDFFFGLIGRPILSFLGILSKFGTALTFYHDHGVVALIVSGFVPIPYIVFTMAAGFNHTLDLTALTIGGFIGRFLRFGLVGVLLYFFGPPVKTFIDKYYERFAVVFLVVLILFYAALRFVI